ncbi:binding partner of ACD11 1-like [Aristolochia californica]|uniref:binding partner of ACD11 1-like n=1 Tax=Aristolochia californica TaxID=171875 RepID=UPI0035D61FA3
MSGIGYTIEVTNLSPHATEKDVYDFFTFSGVIEHVEIVRSGAYACTAYVTFRDPHALETAVLLTGATIVDQKVSISRWGQYEVTNFWDRPTWRIEEDTDPRNSNAISQSSHFVSSTGEAVTMAQEVVKTMVAKGYVLGKDALSRAKAFDESHHVSASAAAKVAELSKRIGLTDKINAGVEAAKSVDERFHVVNTTKAVASATGRTAVAAATAVANSSYFSSGALWVSGALMKASKMAADLATHGSNRS